MKIQLQAILLVLFSALAIFLAGFLSVSQLNVSDKLNDRMYLHQSALVTLNDFQTAANNQVLYGVDLVRTRDISGDRIVAYRTMETKFGREIENLESLKLPGEEELETNIRLLAEKGKKLSNLCKTDLRDPLYAHQELKDGIVELLIYKQLDSIGTEINTIRYKLDRQITDDMIRHTKQNADYIRIYLPVSSGILFLVILFSFIIIQRALNSINKTGRFFETLAAGQSRLDISMPEGGRDEIATLRRNFNQFMRNLNQRQTALKGIAEEQVDSGSSLNQLASEHASAVTQLNQNLNMVHEHTVKMSQQVNSSVEEVHRITSSLDALEKLTGKQSQSVAAVVHRGDSVREALDSQKEAVLQQMLLTRKVKDESMTNRQILDLLRTQINEILSQSTAISNAIVSIQDLADQTDILAINASIESAHAGTYGKGFAVVSGEMRSLSTKVRQNTSLVTELLGELENKLHMMSEEEKQNQESIERLITQNDNAVESIKNLEHSQIEIDGTITELLEVLNSIQTGSRKVHEEADEVRNSSLQITNNMENLKNQQKTLAIESEEMNKGISHLTYGTGFLRELSERNSRTAATLNDEIKKMGSS